MKLAAIVNVWFDSIEHLPHSMLQILGCVDVIIIIDQLMSNRGETLTGEQYDEHKEIIKMVTSSDPRTFIIDQYIPRLDIPAMKNETNKRSQGLQLAKSLGCTHFFHMDSDEYWPDFEQAVLEYVESRRDGSVCQMWTYFKKPTLRLAEPEGYHVPFIHVLRHNTRHDMNYPFWVDPTRRVNQTDIEELTVKMHHMSYVRRDIQMKLRNSSAPHDMENNEYFQDHQRDLKNGDFIKCFKQQLVEVRDLFNLNDTFT